MDVANLSLVFISFRHLRNYRLVDYADLLIGSFGDVRADVFFKAPALGPAQN